MSALRCSLFVAGALCVCPWLCVCTAHFAIVCSVVPVVVRGRGRSWSAGCARPSTVATRVTVLLLLWPAEDERSIASREATYRCTQYDAIWGDALRRDLADA